MRWKERFKVLVIASVACGALTGCASEHVTENFRAATSAARGGDESDLQEFARLQESGAPTFEVVSARSPRGTRFYVRPVHDAGINWIHARRIQGHTGVLVPEPPISDPVFTGKIYRRVIMDDGATYYVHSNPDDFFLHDGRDFRRISAPAEVAQHEFAALRDAGSPMFVVREGHGARENARFRTRPDYGDVLALNEAKQLEGQVGVLAADAAINVETRDNHGYWRVVMENGATYWVRGKADDFFAYASGFYAPTDLDLRATNESRDRLFEGADIYVTTSTIALGGDELELSNGARIKTDSIEAYRALAAAYDDPTAQFLDQLSRLVVRQDFVSGSTTIHSPYAGGGYSEWEPALELYIVKSGARYQLRSRIQYEARGWIFARRYTIAADDFRWEAETTRAWQRNVRGRRIDEWVDAPVTARMRQAAERLADASRATVRFHGRTEVIDRELTDAAQHDLRFMLDLYDALSGG